MNESEFQVWWNLALPFFKSGVFACGLLAGVVMCAAMVLIDNQYGEDF